VAFRFSLIPREEQFFALYKATTGEIKVAAEHLKEMLATDPPDDAKVDIIRDAEHRFDTLTHHPIQPLPRTFIPPFDREDM